MTHSLSDLFERDLNRLADEIKAYPDEKSVWEIAGEISNSGGNLCLHLLGNLNHYIGAQLGDTGYVRDRPLEFSDRNVPRTILLERIGNTTAMLREVLAELSPETLSENHTSEYQGGNRTNTFFLIHLYGHFNYHFGQINYHRRLLSPKQY